MSKKNKVLSEKLFYRLLSLVVITCFICVIVSTLSYTHRQNLWEETLDGVSEIVSSCTKKTEKIYDNVKAVIINGKVVLEDANGNNATEILNDVSEIQKASDESVKYVERLQKVQKDASTNSVMSLVYSILGAVLTTAGAALVAFIFKSKEMAEKAKDAAKESRELYNDQMKIQNGIIEIQKIHIEITHAVIALYKMNKVQASDRIEKIKNEVLNLPSEIDNKSVEQLKKELENMCTLIVNFRDEAEKDYKDSDPANYSTYIDAANNYDSWIKEAIYRCKKILANNQSVKTKFRFKKSK